MYIPEIFNNLLGTDKPSDRSVQMADLDFPHGHTHLIIPSNRFCKQCVWKIKYPEFHNLLNWEPSCHQTGKYCILLNFVKIQNLGTEEVFAPPGSVV